MSHIKLKYSQNLDKKRKEERIVANEDVDCFRHYPINLKGDSSTDLTVDSI